jgi:hypothetical protein
MMLQPGAVRYSLICSVIVLCVTGLFCPSSADYLPASEGSGGDYGYYQINSNPTGADVVFDGKFVGETPTTVPVFSTGPAGHVITVSKIGYVTWTQSYSLNPEPGQTIPVFAPLQSTDLTGSIKITSSPTGALVSLDGQQGQMAPWIYSKVPVGDHTVQAFLSGYSPFSGSVTVSAGQTAELNAVLIPLYSVGSLQVISNPGGAELWVDGVLRGETATTVGNLATGTHDILLRLDGYQDLTGQTTIEQGKVSILTLTLTPAGSQPLTGTVRVSSQPAGAGIYLDDTYEGVTRSGDFTVITGVVPGEHRIDLKMSNFQGYSKMIQVTDGKAMDVNAILTPSPAPGPFATLEVDSEPSGAYVFIDNAIAGVTPVTLTSVPSGSHMVLIQLSGYNDYGVQVNLNPGQSALISTALSPSATARPVTRSGSPLALPALIALAAALTLMRRV